MALARTRCLALSLVLALFAALLLVWPAAGQGLRVWGRALDQRGRPLAGVLLSDGVNLAQSGRQGNLRLASGAGRVVWALAPAGWRVRGRWWWPAAQAAQRKLTIRLAPWRPGPPYKLALLADPHLFRRPGKAGPSPQRARDGWLRAAARSRRLRPHLTVVLGDLAGEADKLTPQRGQAQLAWAAGWLRRLPKPWRALPGNHDLVLGTGDPLAAWRRLLGPARHAFRVGRLLVVMLGNVGRCPDPAGRLQTCGRTSPAALAWLGRLLSHQRPQDPLIVLSHYPLLSPLDGAGPLGPRRLVRLPKGPLALRHQDQGALQLARLLAPHRPLALIAGHLHAAYELQLFDLGHPWLLIGLPAVSGGWWRGPRPFGPLRFRAGLASLRVTRRWGLWQVTWRLWPLSKRER